MVTAVPVYWVFRRSCSCPYGWVKADQSPHRAPLATEAEARAFFFDSPMEREQAEARGVYATPEVAIDEERWHAQHDHPDCTIDGDTPPVHPFSRIGPFTE